MITNLIIDNGKWRERWLLSPFRKEHDRLLALAGKEDDGRAIVIEGEDGIWWNDDLWFVLERMADDISLGVAPPASLRRACSRIEKKKWKVGDSMSVTINGIRISVRADETSVDRGVYKFL